LFFRVKVATGPSHSLFPVRYHKLADHGLLLYWVIKHILCWVISSLITNSWLILQFIIRNYSISLHGNKFAIVWKMKVFPQNLGQFFLGPKIQILIKFILLVAKNILTDLMSFCKRGNFSLLVCPAGAHTSRFFLMLKSGLMKLWFCLFYKYSPVIL